MLDEMKIKELVPQKIVRVGRVLEGTRAWFLAQKPNTQLYIARDDREAKQLLQELSFYAPKRNLLSFPAWDIHPYDKIQPKAAIIATRLASLNALNHGIENPLIVTTLRAVLQKVIPKQVLRDNQVSIALGQRLDEGELIAFLTRNGFYRAATVRAHGEFSIRGGIIDIFPAGFEAPVRLDLFGDVVDSLRVFDAETQRSGEALDKFEILPNSEIVFDEASIERFRKAYRGLVGVPKDDDPYYQAITERIRTPGAENLLPLFYEKLDTIFDYLPHDADVGFDDQFWSLAEQGIEDIESAYQSRVPLDAGKPGREMPLPPEALFFTRSDLATYLSHYKLYELSQTPIPTGANAIDFGAIPVRDFTPERQEADGHLMPALQAYVKGQSAAGKVVFAAESEGAAARLKQLLQNEGFPTAKYIRDINQLAGNGSYLAVLATKTGFVYDDVTLITESDILGKRIAKSKRKRKSGVDALTEASALAAGDLVVHVEHGIGRFIGLERLDIGQASHECLLVEYAGGDKLYVPVENIDILSRYGDDAGNVDKLGASNWQARKAKAKKDLLAMAEGLMNVAAERSLRKAPVLSVSDTDFERFSAGFPFQETDDQLQAIEDVRYDLATGKPSDRLICGDVGFGKTEVAMRASFIAAMSGYQVAIIAPTTLLARQHYKNFKERFRDFPLKVRHLSRFVSAKDAKETRDALANGQVDIVIGTHALLATSVKFDKLGLLIVDEEQHFGVKHKERLKTLKSDIHVLTLSATPIPRTLQLALTGVRELSVMTTPPVDRLAIRTYVSKFDKATIRDALLREKYRGGQSFFVVPRISDLEEIEETLAEIVPELKFITAHGQMAAGDLDDRMTAFYEGEADVLLATTIVESGLDIPRANTLIVHRADMFGLGQLYQIRGRVGRSRARAYAYLMTKANAPLTSAAEKRLHVLSTMEELGAGFALAAQDLDIRGAGNLLGDEQSGQIKEIGFALYQSMLKEAIAKMKAGDLSSFDTDGFVPNINLNVSVLIPDNYVSDLDTRLNLYRRLARLSKKADLESFAAELIDRFGPLPTEVEMLLKTVRIKAFCKRANISDLETGPHGAVVKFHRNSYPNPRGLVAFMDAMKGKAKAKDTRLVIMETWVSEEARLLGAAKIAQLLAKYAVEGAPQ